MSTNKDILLGLVGSMSDNECRDVLYFITDREYEQSSLVDFDLVHITKNQYNKLVWMWGEEKTKACIEILNKWLSTKNITKKISHYRQLVGWVERKYHQDHGVSEQSLVGYGDIKYKWQAKKYIQGIPKELRWLDSQVKYLVNKFDIDIRDVQ